GPATGGWNRLQLQCGDSGVVARRRFHRYRDDVGSGRKARSRTRGIPALLQVADQHDLTGDALGGEQLRGGAQGGTEPRGATRFRESREGGTDRGAVGGGLYQDRCGGIERDERNSPPTRN